MRYSLAVADEDPSFSERWDELALDATVASAPGDATIVPRTLLLEGADVRTAETLDAARGPAGTVKLPPPGAASPARDELPRISVAAATASAPDVTVPQGRGSGNADFEIYGLLGEGGMGRVHVARQRSLRRDVAIKTTKSGAPPSAGHALVGEAVITGLLEHPGIIPVHALGVDDEKRPLLVMKRIDGVEWRALVRDPAHPEWSRWTGADDRLVAHLEILMQVCNAASFAHSRGILHRDIKPENVMIGRFGEVYLVDWGVALKLEDGPAARALAGSPAYMAPEMASGAGIDARADVYLLGATLHEVLTGELRHSGATLRDVLAAACASRPVAYDASVPPELARIANQATARRPEDRPQSALELRTLLAGFLEHRGSMALSDAAGLRLAEARALLGEVAVDGLAPLPPLTDDDEARVRRSLGEATFGFSLSLAEWPENPSARQGEARAHAARVELELRQDNPRAARALLRERAVPEWEDHVARLEARHAAATAETERLQQMAKDLDPRTAARQRALALAALAVAGTMISGYALHQRSMGVALGHRDVIGFAIAAAASGAVIMFVLRKKLLANAFNRGLAGSLGVGIAALLGNRVATAVQGTPVLHVFAFDLLLFTAVSGAIGATLLRPMRWLVPIFATGAIVAMLDPELAPVAFSVTAAVASVATGLILYALR